MQTFEKKYNAMILRKLERLEKQMAELALEQARNQKDNQYIDDGLFPKGVTAVDYNLFRDNYRD